MYSINLEKQEQTAHKMATEMRDRPQTNRHTETKECRREREKEIYNLQTGKRQYVQKNNPRNFA